MTTGGPTEFGAAFGKPKRLTRRFWVEAVGTIALVAALSPPSLNAAPWWFLAVLILFVYGFAGFGATRSIRTGMGSFGEGFLVGYSMAFAAGILLTLLYLAINSIQGTLWEQRNFPLLGGGDLLSGWHRLLRTAGENPSLPSGSSSVRLGKP